MFRLGEENPWFFHTETDRNVDFCIWVLEVDGLRVPPFEYHAEGNGSLRAAGLDEESWQEWVTELIRRNDQSSYTAQKQSVQTTNEVFRTLLAKAGLPNDPHSEIVQDYLQTHPQEFTQLLIQAQQAQPGRFFPHSTTPLEAWSGSPEIGERLRELWVRYEAIAKQRFTWEKDFQADQRTNRKGTKSLWQALSPYHTRLDSLMIHFVGYSQESVYLVPPRSIIMTVVHGHLDDEDFRTRTLRAAETLTSDLSS